MNSERAAPDLVPPPPPVLLAIALPRWQETASPDAVANARRSVADRIGVMLRKARPNAPANLVLQIPALAHRIEAMLFDSAPSLAAFEDTRSLEHRMRAAAVRSSCARPKRLRQTPQNSSCDLMKLQDAHRKRAMLGDDEYMDGTGPVRPLRPRSRGAGIVVSVSAGAQQLAFNFSSRPARPEDDDDNHADHDDEDLDSSDDDGDNDQEHEQDSAAEALAAVHSQLAALLAAAPHDTAAIAAAVLALRTCAPALLLDAPRRRRLAEALASAVSAFAQQHASSALPGPDPDAAQPPHPVTLVAGLAAELLARAPVDLDLLEVLLLLPPLCAGPAAPLGPRDAELLAGYVDRFARADPPRAALAMAHSLLRRWPRAASEAQALLLGQLGALLDADAVAAGALRPPVLARAAECARHDNWHVAGAAMDLAEAQMGAAAPADWPLETLQQLAAALARCGREHWHEAVRERAMALRLRLCGAAARRL